MLLFMHVYIPFKIPTALLTVVDRRLELVLGLRRHVIDVVRSEEMLIQVLECQPSVPGTLSWLNVGPRRMLPSNLRNNVPNLPVVRQVNWVERFRPIGSEGIVASPADHLLLNGSVNHGRIKRWNIRFLTNNVSQRNLTFP